MNRAERRAQEERAIQKTIRFISLWNYGPPMEWKQIKIMTDSHRRQCSHPLCKRYQGETPPDKGPLIEDWE